jgi:hypothetical protein
VNENLASAALSKIQKQSSLIDELVAKIRELDQRLSALDPNYGSASKNAGPGSALLGSLREQYRAAPWGDARGDAAVRALLDPARPATKKRSDGKPAPLSGAITQVLRTGQPVTLGDGKGDL